MFNCQYDCDSFKRAIENLKDLCLGCSSINKDVCFLDDLRDVDDQRVKSIEWKLMWYKIIILRNIAENLVENKALFEWSMLVPLDPLYKEKPKLVNIYKKLNFRHIIAHSYTHKEQNRRSMCFSVNKGLNFEDIFNFEARLISVCGHIINEYNILTYGV